MALSRKSLWLPVLFFTLLCGSAQAQQATAIVQIRDPAYWRCELPGGVYVVNVATLASVSTHEYVVDGAARVTELTVATNSAVVARFYYLEPMVPKSPVGAGQSLIDKAQQRGEEAAGRAGLEEVWKKVVKNYPVTTHAHTVEYRLDSVDQVKKAQRSLEAAWRTNRDTQIKIHSDDN